MVVGGAGGEGGGGGGGDAGDREQRRWVVSVMPLSQVALLERAVCGYEWWRRGWNRATSVARWWRKLKSGWKRKTRIPWITNQCNICACCWKMEPPVEIHNKDKGNTFHRHLRCLSYKVLHSLPPYEKEFMKHWLRAEGFMIRFIKYLRRDINGPAGSD